MIIEKSHPGFYWQQNLFYWRGGGLALDRNDFRTYGKVLFVSMDTDVNKSTCVQSLKMMKYNYFCVIQWFLCQLLCFLSNSGLAKWISDVRDKGSPHALVT